MARREELQCRIHPLSFFEDCKYVVICTRYGEKWVLSRHKDRATWEAQGGHIEAGETPLECARRELYEESGIREAEIFPVCDYWGFDARGGAAGRVYLAVARTLGSLPNSEMAEIRLFEPLPENLTYPRVSPKLYLEAEKLLKTLLR